MKNLLISTLIIAASLAAVSFSPSTASAQTGAAPAPRLKPAATSLTALPAHIAIARIDNGKLVAAPHDELRDFAALSGRIGDAVTFAPISPAALSRDLGANIDSSNKLDEIRMLAAASGHRFAIIYGTGADARWNSFGRMALRDTGLTVPAGQQLSPKGQAKALIVGAYSGTIYATVTSNTRTGGIDDLTRRIEAVLGEISADAEPFIAS